MDGTRRKPGERQRYYRWQLQKIVHNGKYNFDIASLHVLVVSVSQDGQTVDSVSSWSTVATRLTMTISKRKEKMITRSSSEIERKFQRINQKKTIERNHKIENRKIDSKPTAQRTEGNMSSNNNKDNEGGEKPVPTTKLVHELKDEQELEDAQAAWQSAAVGEVAEEASAILGFDGER